MQSFIHVSVERVRRKQRGLSKAAIIELLGVDVKEINVTYEVATAFANCTKKVSLHITVCTCVPCGECVAGQVELALHPRSTSNGKRRMPSRNTDALLFSYNCEFFLYSVVRADGEPVIREATLGEVLDALPFDGIVRALQPGETAQDVLSKATKDTVVTDDMLVTACPLGPRLWPIVMDVHAAGVGTRWAQQ